MFTLRPAELKRIYHSAMIDIYASDSGERYTVKPVPQGKHQPGWPMYYLSYEGPEDDHPQYLSGLFQTAMPGAFSGDTKSGDKKLMFIFKFHGAGETATLLPKESTRRPRRAPTRRRSLAAVR